MQFLEYSTNIDAGKMNTVHLYSNLVNAGNKIIGGINQNSRI